MPDIDKSAGDRIALLILYPAIDEQFRPRRRRAHDRAAIFGARRIHPPERPEQVGGGFGLAVVAVVKQTYQRREAERARHQHDFIVRLVGKLTHLGNNLRAELEFLLGQMHIAREGMQVLDQRGNDLAQARVFDVLVGVHHDRCDILLALDDHLRSLPCAARGTLPIEALMRLLVEEVIYLSRGLRINSGHM